jgi:hypothetical protein
MFMAASGVAQTGYFGKSKININPATPVVLSGYAARSNLPEATGVQQNIVAQAAVFGDGADAAILFTVDCTGVPDNVVDPLKQRLSTSLGIAPERIAVSCTHSHSCPHVTGYLPNLYSPPLTNLEQQHVDQYTRELAEKLESAAIQAMSDRTPGHQISWGSGTVGFAANRRGSSEVDHDLPVMVVRDSVGQAAAIITSYAAHAVTLNYGDNLVSGDWPGYARERIEAMFPGAAAMVMIGAGADANPNAFGLAAAQNHGQSIANEIQRLITHELLTPVSQDLSAFHSEIELDYATTLTPGDPASARLAPAPNATMYGVTSWTFGKDLAMVFMEGEVVVDYSLRLKSELGDKLWVNGYSNDVQGYIPSERILYEGGYEADSSGYYYGLPGRFAHGIEDKIVGAVHEQLGEFFDSSDRLRLLVNWETGAATLQNLSDNEISLDAYTISSPSARLSAAASAWRSMQDQGLAGWDEADNSNANRLTEFLPTGATVIGPGRAIALGRPFASVAPNAFGDPTPPGDLEFSYHTSDEGRVTGIVGYHGPPNNLVLAIDPATGAAAIQNTSTFFDVAIDGYSIASAAGKLLVGDANWHSLDDQNEGSWDQADNANSFRVSEFSPVGATLLDQHGRILELGTLVDVVGDEISASDFTFSFSTANGDVIEGLVVVGELAGTSLAGDFDGNGAVDGADFLQWQRTLGAAAAPPASGADADANGVVNAGDLTVWRSHFGSESGAGSAQAAVPEPPSLVAACIAFSTTFLASRVSRPS